MLPALNFGLYIAALRAHENTYYISQETHCFSWYSLIASWRFRHRRPRKFTHECGPRSVRIGGGLIGTPTNEIVHQNREAFTDSGEGLGPRMIGRSLCHSWILNYRQLTVLGTLRRKWRIWHGMATSTGHCDARTEIRPRRVHELSKESLRLLPVHMFTFRQSSLPAPPDAPCQSTEFTNQWHLSARRRVRMRANLKAKWRYCRGKHISAVSKMSKRTAGWCRAQWWI